MTRLSARSADRMRVPLPDVPPASDAPVTVRLTGAEAEALLRLAREGAATIQHDPSILPRVALRHGAATGLRRHATAIRTGVSE